MDSKKKSTLKVFRNLRGKKILMIKNTNILINSLKICQHPVHKQPQPSQTFSLPAQYPSAKPPSTTISNANVTVSATFSIPLKNKVVPAEQTTKAPTSTYSFQNSLAGGTNVTASPVAEKKPLSEMGTNIFGTKKPEKENKENAPFSMAGLAGLGGENKFLSGSNEAAKPNFSFASGASTGFSFGGSEKSLSFAPAPKMTPTEPKDKEPSVTIKFAIA